MIAHIAGAPIEESLPWLVPVGSFGLVGIAALLRDGAERAGRTAVRQAAFLVSRSKRRHQGAR